MIPKSDLIDVPERRAVAVSDFEIRKSGDLLSLRGYASVFDAPYDIYGGPEKGGWTEIVDKRAFDVTLREKPDLHLLINHEGMPLARTKSGTLKLSTDSTGLLVDAPDLDRRDPDVQRLEVKMERGDMDEMSFAFRVKKQEWEDDETLRRLTEVSSTRATCRSSTSAPTRRPRSACAACCPSSTTSTTPWRLLRPGR
ncbi:MAG: HK97 family phage prohead protease [Nocardioidaceae bacterium]|nr:MAG: HK97 family phage prohead protease [Nocardioidaceae bacterium]